MNKPVLPKVMFFRVYKAWEVENCNVRLKIKIAEKLTAHISISCHIEMPQCHSQCQKKKSSSLNRGKKNTNHFYEIARCFQCQRPLQKCTCGHKAKVWQDTQIWQKTAHLFCKVTIPEWIFFSFYPFATIVHCITTFLWLAFSFAGVDGLESTQTILDW